LLTLRKCETIGRMAHKKGSKGLAGGYGGYRARYRWDDDRTRPVESETQRAARQRLIDAFLARGGRIQRYPPQSARGLPPALTRELGLDVGDALELLPA
jgi:hypothetical protein